MFDLHSHLLPGIDDGAPTLEEALKMARLAVADGVLVQACTPHIMPGVYNNSGPAIIEAVANLQEELDKAEIPLLVVPGADVHLVHDIVAGLNARHLLTIAQSRYVLVEPPHHVPPVRMVDLFFGLLIAGYQPILTHPERFGWVRSHFHLIEQLFHGGVWMQITASSITGDFGREPKYWSERMLEAGMVHILASDCHDSRRRPPNLLRGRDSVAKIIGEAEATHMVVTRPRCVLENQAPATAPSPMAFISGTELGNDVKAHGRRAEGADRARNHDLVGRWAGRVRGFLGRNA